MTRPSLTRSDSQQGTPSFLPDALAVPPPASLPRPPGAAGGVGGLDIASIQANVRAKLALMMKTAPPPSTPPPPPPPSSSRPLPPVPGLPKPNLDPDLAKKVADAKRLVESMQARKLAMSRPANPYLVRHAEARPRARLRTLTPSVSCSPTRPRPRTTLCSTRPSPRGAVSRWRRIRS